MILTQSSLLSSLAGVSHGFLSNHTEAEKELLQKTEPSVATARQVHGDLLIWIEALEKRAREADGLATLQEGLSVGVHSADCAPLLMVALDSSSRPLAVAAIHAGWRGTAQEIGGKSFELFSQATAEKGAVRFAAVIGPCISQQSFEVGEEVVAAFPGSEERGIARFLRQEEGRRKFLFDLPGENARQLRNAAARRQLPLALETMGLCTLQLRERFPSFRRDREKAGRLLSYLSFHR